MKRVEELSNEEAFRRFQNQPLGVSARALSGDVYIIFGHKMPEWLDAKNREQHYRQGLEPLTFRNTRGRFNFEKPTVYSTIRVIGDEQAIGKAPVVDIEPSKDGMHEKVFYRGRRGYEVHREWRALIWRNLVTWEKKGGEP